MPLAGENFLMESLISNHFLHGVITNLSLFIFFNGGKGKEVVT